VLRMRPKNSRRVWKGLVAGIAGGLAGTIVMTQFQAGWNKASEVLDSRTNGRSGRGKSRSKSNEKGEDATMKAAGKIAQLADQRLSRQQKQRSRTAVHYAFGTALGALSGIARELSPDTLLSMHPELAGVGYGSAVFVGADELAVPALGLSESPKDTPLSSHAYGLASHAVYGLTGEPVRKAVSKYRALWDKRWKAAGRCTG
jgi:putative membrane protein